MLVLLRTRGRLGFDGLRGGVFEVVFFGGDLEVKFVGEMGFGLGWDGMGWDGGVFVL